MEDCGEIIISDSREVETLEMPEADIKTATDGLLALAHPDSPEYNGTTIFFLDLGQDTFHAKIELVCRDSL